MQTLGVAMGFVGNYAPCGLSPQTDGMPVIHLKGHAAHDLNLKKYIDIVTQFTFKSYGFKSVNTLFISTKC